MSSALGMCCDSAEELIVGIITSWFLFTTSVGRVMALSQIVGFAGAAARSCGHAVRPGGRGRVAAD
jgi:hypothetical protein